MSNPGEPDVVTSPRFPAHLSAIPAPREQRQDRDLHPGGTAIRLHQNR